MSLYKRGNTWHYDFTSDGQRFRGSTKETVQSRARTVESLLMAEARERGRTLISKRAPVLSEFSQRFFQWVEAGQLEPKSKLYYRNGWRLIQATQLAGMRLDRITTDEVEAIRFGKSASNANNALRTLRRMMGKAEEWGVIRHAPRVKLAKEYGRSQLIDQDAESKLLAVASQPLKDVLKIMLDTGMRPQEVFRMRWEDVNWEGRTAFIPFGKTRNSRRYVPISQRVMEALSARARKNGSEWVFPSDSMTGHLDSVNRAFASAREKAGLSKSLVLYCARHTFATHALAATGNLAAVMKALGHSNAQTAMIYQHPGIDAIRQAVEERNLDTTSRHNSRHNDVVVQ